MIHYHCAEISDPASLFEALNGGHGFLTWRQTRPYQKNHALAIMQSFAVDNGAFSAWRKQRPITDWTPYYGWVAEIASNPHFDFAVIPDIIDGDEQDNDALLKEWPLPKWQGAPVWHLHESLERLARLADDWPRVCLGSSGDYQTPGSEKWEARMQDAMAMICDGRGFPRCKLHGLRMLDPRLYTRYPLASADSSNIARNIQIDSAWRGTYTPPNKPTRAYVLRRRIENENAPTQWTPSEAVESEPLENLELF